MTGISIAGLLLFLLLVVGAFGYGFVTLFGGLFAHYYDRFCLVYFSYVDRRPYSKHEEYIRGRIPYYDKLSSRQQVKFLLRVRRFLRFKSFEGRHGLEVTEEMKALVAASAVQLTFGLREFVLVHFNTIILYPGEFFNKRTEQYHMGETHTTGVIALSWSDLKHGFEKSDDAINVGLHEMSHALELEWLLRKNYDELFGNYFGKWSRIIQNEFDNVQNERSTFLREYAGTNKREFFAVCVEYFFESPNEFRLQLPEIYTHLSLLLNQDPLRNDVIVEEPPMRAREDMLPEIEGSTPLLEVRLSVSSLFYYLRFIMIGLAIFAVHAFDDRTQMPYFLGTAALVPVACFFFVSRIQVFERYLVVRRPWGSVREIYELENIAAIEMTTHYSGAYLYVIRVRNGTTLLKKHYYFGRVVDQEKFVEIMHAKNVPVKK